jgi:hypothetical protein
MSILFCASPGSGEGELVVILDYSEVTYEERLLGETWEEAQSFYRAAGVCPTCKVAAPVVRDTHWSRGDTDPLSDPCTDEHWHASVRSCECGWWDIFCEGNSGHDSIDPPADFTPRHLRAVLRRFAPKSAEVPMAALREALRKRPELLYGLHFEAMERLVADLLAGVYDCEVIHCGRSGDGGVDLLILDSDNPTAVQVKRRTRAGIKEAVAPIRELTAAALLRGCAAAIYASNADAFTQPAQETAKNAVDLRLLRSYQLIDRGRLVNLLTSTATEQPWRPHLTGLQESQLSW